ncbi:MAG: sulfide/dihydroorotate dehydrogenase-like FAD/NAD-binding protein [Selenomonas sp.]|jgi:ferredoxin--NADP+ reductase|nr:sulfide/dihydroorotate dehydrogenase-like FAD/NAD-binding protein [Selenomonas sp.]MCI7330627.1 sulfide/dihydroorotate dehydrogenase-like FAD/NAD-binding protein [Selenomonadaceae bacterium]MDD6119221.1 sulfide/dihydroorotate dehydrogenase-like FAD/NAD-binding protein [Selenomonadaceae bacterium]MDD7055475.1 sulfide/dihydroorotate dehydrogenase-like FAD/NAD-binding protein [Selenomonadaceae bacterium]MDY3915793.1 sulfide/dihydroorotate dehydrogenase-like FAD/NAD-binding protein [Selenomonada
MFKILAKKELSPNVYAMTIEAPRVARKAQPGQFIILRIDEEGERIPLTIADFDREKGTILLVFQTIGASTMELAAMNAGDSLLDFVGPLGQPSVIKKMEGTVVVVGGGIGVAPTYPIARAMKEAGNKVIAIMGAKTKDILIMEDMMKQVTDEILVTTDDGSRGIKGFVTYAVQALVDRGEKIAQITAIGPCIMMKSVADATRDLGIRTIVSLNPIMVDGTGMCGGCRVTVGGETKFACVDGPEFDGHQVDFKGLMSRQRMYRDLEAEEKDHVCRIGLGRK